MGYGKIPLGRQKLVLGADELLFHIAPFKIGSLAGQILLAQKPRACVCGLKRAFDHVNEGPRLAQGEESVLRVYVNFVPRVFKRGFGAGFVGPGGGQVG